MPDYALPGVVNELVESTAGGRPRSGEESRPPEPL